MASTTFILALNLLFFTLVTSIAAQNPPPTQAPTPTGTCPIDVLKLRVCTTLLPFPTGTPSNTPCCTLVGGLADLDAAVCLCTAIKASALGINVNVPLTLSVLLNFCGKTAPTGFQCA